MKPFLSSLVGLWSQLGLNQRVSLVVAMIAVIGGLIGLTLWSQRPDYQLLYGRLAEKDTSAVITLLQAQNIPHRLEAGGSAIYVPAEHVHRLRAELAQKSMLTGDGVGFELFDKNQFGLSDFVQRTNYARALQGELARTISQIDGVRSARVMITQPETRLLVTGQGLKPSASVLVEVARARLEIEAVNAIRQLVAYAVQGLVPDQVTVVDQRGRLLSAELRDDPTLATASSQMRYRQGVEDYFARKVESMLLPVVGEGNVVVRVSADIETEATSFIEEKFDPDVQVVRRQTSTEDVTNTVEVKGGGVVGVAANTPDQAPVGAEAGPQNSSEQSRKVRETDYAINKLITNTTRAPGTIRSLTAAVFVAPRADAEGKPAVRTPAEVDALRRIVINALGLKPREGESLDTIVTVQEAPFQAEQVAQQVQDIASANQLTPWIDLATRVGAGFVAAIVLFMFLRMLSREKPQAVPLELLTTPPTTANANANGEGGLSPEILNELIRHKPAHVGTALREWVAVPKKN